MQQSTAGPGAVYRCAASNTGHCSSTDASALADREEWARSLAVCLPAPDIAVGEAAGQYLLCPGGEWSVPGGGYVHATVNGVPIVSTSEEIDVTTADQLRAMLLEASSGREPVIVLDMSGTQFCDSAGLHTVLKAHRRVVAEGRELRVVVVAADGAVPRLLELTGVPSRPWPNRPTLSHRMLRPPAGPGWSVTSWQRRLPVLLSSP